ncbi:MAG: UvrD-helicase domain-containing protein, partial [Christensenellales bacterium]
MGYTDLQKKAIYERGGNLLVSASAGSGKTTVMIQRVLSLLSEGASLENMVICTFTRSAAA